MILLKCPLFLKNKDKLEMLSKLGIKDLDYEHIGSKGKIKYQNEDIVAVIAVRWRSISIYGNLK
jgi:hypothetical protein